MQSFKKALIRAVSFILIFLVLCNICEFFLLKYEGHAYVTMNDLAKEKDLDVVVIGNSEACRHFNPYLFQDLTGKESFNLSRTASIVPTQYFLIEEMFETHQPEAVMVFFDPLTLQRTTESSFIEATLWPHLTSPMRRLEYALALAKADNSYLDRLFPWRSYMTDTLGDLKSNILNKISTLKGDENYYNYAYSLLNEKAYAYPGKGFGPIRLEKGITQEEINKNCKQVYTKKEYRIHEEVQNWIRKMDELCRKNNSQLIAVAIPRLPGYALGSMLNNYDAQAQFFSELGVPFWNFSYAKENLMPRLDASYYYDLHHLTWAGADVLTESLANVFNAYQRGEDVTDLFYTTEEYLASIDYVTNTWFTEKKQDDQTQLTAYANHGTNVVPEYCFAKIDATGTETILQDYSAENVCLVKLAEGEKVRLYARNANNLEQEPVSFELA